MRLECSNIVDGEPCGCQTFKIQVPPKGTSKGDYVYVVCDKCGALYLLKCLRHDSMGTFEGVINYITGVQLIRYSERKKYNG